MTNEAFNAFLKMLDRLIPQVASEDEFRIAKAISILLKYREALEKIAAHGSPTAKEALAYD